MPKFLSVIFLVFFIMCFGGVSEVLAGKLREKQIAADNVPHGFSQSGFNGGKLYKAKLCHTCHGIEGRKALMPMYPTLNGQKNNYLFQQMMDIRDGRRNNGMSSVMKAVTANVTEREMRAIANYLSRLSSKKIVKKKRIKTSKGRELYKSKLCHTCHGSKGYNPISDTYPRLAGQSEVYLVQQALDIKNRKRTNGMSNAMLPFLGMANEKELRQISKYLASLNG